MYPSVKLDLNRYPLVRALMTAKHGVSRGNQWHLIIKLFDTHSELTDTEWYDLADFLEATMALNGFELTAEDYERFVQAHDGSHHGPGSPGTPVDRDAIDAYDLFC